MTACVPTIRSNPLLYPAGHAVGVDWSNPAANGLIFSAVARGSRFPAIFGAYGVPAVTGTVTATTDGNIGPSQLYATSSNLQWTAAIPVPATQTLAIIYRPTSAPASTPLFTVFDFSSNGAGLALSSANLQFFNAGSVVSTLALAINVPYFIVVSNNTTTVNMTVKNLRTGVVKFFTAAGLAPGTATTNFITIGQCVGRFAAAMYSGAFLSQAQQMAFAADPWSFWYPRTLDLTTMRVSSGGAVPTGTLAATEAPDVAAFAGAFSDNGTLATTESPDIAAFVGNVTYTGTLAATEAPDVAAFAGAFSDNGTLATTESPDIAAFAGAFSDNGTLAATESPDVAAFAGTFGGAVTGTLATTESPDVAAFAGDYIVTLALTTTESPDVAALVGDYVVALVLATTESPDVAAFAGAFSDSGTLATTESPDVAAFAGDYIVTLALATTEAPDVASIIGAGATNSGTLATTEAPDVAAFAGAYADGTSGQTVLSNNGPAGPHFSKKKWLALLDEMRREREASARPVKKPNKTAAAAVKNAERIAASVAEIADAADAVRLARMVEDARSVSATVKAFHDADLAVAKANEAISFARALQKAIEEDDEDEVLMMLLVA